MHRWLHTPTHITRVKNEKQNKEVTAHSTTHTHTHITFTQHRPFMCTIHKIIIIIHLQVSHKKPNTQREREREREREKRHTHTHTLFIKLKKLPTLYNYITTHTSSAHTYCPHMALLNICGSHKLLICKHCVTYHAVPHTHACTHARMHSDNR